MSDRRRISFLITELDHGGAERALVQIATGLHGDRWDVSVICLSQEGPLAVPLRDAGIPVFCLNARSIWSPIGLWHASVGLICLLRRLKPCLVQTFLFHANIPGRFAGRLAAVPIIVSGIRVAERRSRWRLRVDRWTQWLVDRHLCVSQAVADFSIRQSGLPPEKISVIPNGVDARLFQSAPPFDLKTLGIPEDAWVVLAVGRLDPQKAPELLLDAFSAAFADDSKAHLLFAGDGPMRDQLRQTALSRGIADRVHLPGWQSDIPGIMRASALLVLASRWEGMPNVVLEAGAAGLPLIATRSEGVGEIVISGVSGTLVECDHAEELEQAMKSARECQSRFADMAKHLQLIVMEDFTWDRVVAEYAACYADLIRESR